MIGFNYSRKDFPITTGISSGGEEIVEYLGLVISDVTSGIHVGIDVLVGIKNIFGGRGRLWGNTLKSSKEETLNGLVNDSKALGAAALIDVKLEDGAIGSGEMTNIKAIGTAVTLK